MKTKIKNQACNDEDPTKTNHTCIADSDGNPIKRHNQCNDNHESTDDNNDGNSIVFDTLIMWFACFWTFLFSDYSRSKCSNYFTL